MDMMEGVVYTGRPPMVFTDINQILIKQPSPDVRRRFQEITLTFDPRELTLDEAQMLAKNLKVFEGISKIRFFNVYGFGKCNAILTKSLNPVLSLVDKLVHLTVTVDDEIQSHLARNLIYCNELETLKLDLSPMGGSLDFKWSLILESLGHSK